MLRLSLDEYRAAPTWVACGRRTVVVGSRRIVLTLDWETLFELKPPRVRHMDSVVTTVSVLSEADQESLAVGCQECLYIWDAQQRMTHPVGWVRRVRKVPAGIVIAADTLQIWQGLKLLQRWGADSVHDVDVDEHRILMAGRAPAVMDHSFRVLKQFQLPKLWATSCVLRHPIAVIGGADGVLREWDYESARFREWDAQARILSIAMNSSGVLAVGTVQRQVHLYQDGWRVGVLEGHRLGVPSVAFSPDGKYVVTGSYDGTARIWETATKEALVAVAILPNNGWAFIDLAQCRYRYDGSEESRAELRKHLVFQDGVIERPLTEEELDRYCVNG